MSWNDTTWYCNFGDGSTTGHYAVAKRPQNTAVAAGQIVRQFTAPAVGSERVFVCTVAGTTANTTDATWTITRGAITTDGTAKWCEITGVAALNGDAVNTQTWAQARAAGNPSVGLVLKRANGASYQICTVLNTFGPSGTEPAFSDTAGVTTVETSGPTWTCIGPVSNFTGGQAPHARLANALATNWFASGNTVYVGDNHAETQTGSISISSSSALLAKVLCHNHSGSYPPSASDITTGATITTSNNAITITAQGSFYFYGITFVAQNFASNVGASSVGQVQNWYYFDNCSWQIIGSGATLQLGAGSTAWGIVVFNNTTFKCTNVNAVIVPYFANFIWQNTGQILAAGSSVPTTLLVPTAAGRLNNVTFSNLDLSQLTGSLFSGANTVIGTLIVQDCKLNAAMTVTTPINTGMNVQLIRSDSAGTSYKSQRINYEGTETTETSIVRTGGAVDPLGQAQSRKIVTSANSQWLRPFKAEPMVIWNAVTGANVTATVYGTVNAGALPMNDDLWLECEYLGDAGLPASPTAFNPADLLNVALSNNNLTASCTASVGGVRGVIGVSSGKIYFEVTVSTWTSSFTGVGVAPAGASLSDGLGVAGASRSGISHNGTVWVSGSNVATMPSQTSGNVICIALDRSSARVWYRSGAAGSWNAVSGTANDPATGVGGVDISSLSGALFPGFWATASGDGATANFGATAFTGAVPSGFTAGLSNPAIPASPLGKFVTTTKASVLASNAAVSSDSSVWNGTSVVAGTWNPSDKSANITLSNGNLTAAGNNSSDGGVRSTPSKSSGKLYFEVTWLSATGGVDAGCGIATAAAVLTTMGSTAAGAALVFQSGAIYVNGSNTGITIGTHTGKVCIAVDLTNSRIWFRNDGGIWNNSGTADPATNTGGIDISTLFPSNAAFAAVTVQNTTNTYTANFGGTAFAQAMPSGFSAWDTGWLPFKLTATLSSPQPQLAGYLHARVRAAKASTTFYIDPQVTLT